jgi:hypothetical protein
MASGSSRKRSRPFTSTLLVGLSNTRTARTAPTAPPEMTHSAPPASESQPTTTHESPVDDVAASPSSGEDVDALALTVDARAREDDAREDDAHDAREDEHADEDVARDVCAEARRATVASRAASMVAGRGVTFALGGHAAAFRRAIPER